MALSGKLLADFENFYAATQKAEVHLRGMETGAGKVGTSLNRMAESFSGRKLIQDATLATEAVTRIGGASKLTEIEQRKLAGTLSEAIAKFKALGVEVPPQMMKVAEATGAIAPKLSLADKAAALATTSFGQMFGAFTAAGVATALLSKLAAGAQQFIAQGAKLPAVQQSFERLSIGVSQNSQAMLSNLQTATKGMVSNYDLMLSANKAMLLGLPVTTKSMGELAKTATVLGKAMGQDATKSLDDLITALGRSSPMILDNLGLSVKVGEANERYAKALGKTAEQLTDAEKKTAFYNAAMEAARKKTAELGDQSRTLGEIATTAWTQIGNVVSDSVATMNVGIGKVLSSGKEFKQFLADAAEVSVGYAIAMARVRDEAEALAKVKKPDVLLPGPAIDMAVKYSAELAKAKATIENLSVVTKAGIQAALDLGESQTKVASDFKISEGALRLLVEQFQKHDQATKKAAEDAKQRAKELLDIQDKLFGADLVKKAQDYAIGLKDIDDIGKLTRQSQADLHKTMVEALAVLTRSGQGASLAALHFRELRDATVEVEMTTLRLAKMGDPLKEFTKQRQQAFRDTQMAILDNNTAIQLNAEYYKHAGEIADAEMAKTRKAVESVAPVAQSTASSISNSFNNTWVGVANGAAAMASQVERTLAALAQTQAYKAAGIFVAPGFGTADEINRMALRSSSLPRFQSGGPVTQDGPIYAHRGEFVLPKGGSPGNTINVYVTANTKREGEAAGDALVATLKQKGIRL